MTGPNAVVTNGVKDLDNGVIYFCQLQISQALVGRFEGFERRLGFCDDIGQRRHCWSVLLAATGSRWASFGMVISTIEEHYILVT